MPIHEYGATLRALVKCSHAHDLVRVEPGHGSRKPRKKRIKYTNEPIGEVRVVRGFLPTPDELVFTEEASTVTLALSRRSVEFFKAEAVRHRTQYQKMTRRLLDRYAKHYSR